MIIINKYLWDLKIENISLAWEDLYREADSDFPKGTVIELESDSSKRREIFADPVICRQLLIGNFEKYSDEAKKVLASLNSNFNKKDFNMLVELDSILYTILSYWLDDLLDLPSMDPKFFMEELIDSAMDHYLYTLTNPNPRLESIDDYRLLDFK